MTKNIVIVGGGFAGTQVGNALEKALEKTGDKDHRIILVEKKSHFYHAIAGLRSAVVDWDDRILIPYTNLFQSSKNKVIQASAVQLEDKVLTLDRAVPEFGDRINYDYLILATGTQYPAPAKTSALDYNTTRSQLKELRADVKGANSIVIVGGGPVGIELAGEIRDVYANKTITIVHSNDNLLDSTSSPNEKMRSRLLDLMRKNKIDTVFNDSVEIPGDLKEHFYKPAGSIVQTRNGKTIQGVDLVLLAFGNRPETDWLKSTSFGANLINTNGYIKVKKSLQVDQDGISNIFVLGDAADLYETKLAYRIGGHVPVLVENLVQIAVKKNKPTAEYKKGPDAMFVTFGKNGGVGVLPLFGGVTVGNWVVSSLKSKTLFISNSWKTLNAKEPAAK